MDIIIRIGITVCAVCLALSVWVENWDMATFYGVMVLIGLHFDDRYVEGG